MENGNYSVRLATTQVASFLSVVQDMSKVLNAYLMGVATGVLLDQSSTVMALASAAVGAAVAIHPLSGEYVTKAGHAIGDQFHSIKGYFSEEEKNTVLVE